MEKLEPILRYRFWILFGIAILAPSIGWMISSKAMTEEVNKTWKNVEGKFDEISNDKSMAATFPNEKYTTGLKEITAKRRNSYSKAHIKLRDLQKQYMVWPNAIADEMAKVGYQQAPPEQVLFIYNDCYLQELDRVREIVTPYDAEIEEGLVDIPEEVLPRADMSDWIGSGPTAPVLWDTQEDIWMLTAIMEAVAHVNKDATSIVDSPIKSIFEVSLRGGSPQKAQQTAKMKKKGPVEPSLNDRKEDEKRGAAARAVDFDPRDEFGDEKIPNPKAAAAKSANEDDRGKRGRRVKEEDGRPSGEPAEIVKRYIEGDNSPGSQHKVRGFYIKVAMKNTFVPELIAELSNMPFPTEIVRVQLADEVNRSFVRGRIEKTTPTPTAGVPTLADAGGAARKPAGLLGGGPMTFSKAGQERDRQKSENRTRAAEKKKLLESKGKMQNNRGDAGTKDLLQASLDDPYLGTVVISGTMTIYRQAFEKNDPNMKPNPSVKSQAAAPADQNPPAPDETPEKAPAQPAAATSDKKGTEQNGAGKTTNGK